MTGGPVLAHVRSIGVGVPGAGSGEVVGVVGAGWYLRVGERLTAVLDPGSEPGPIHLVTARRAPRPERGSTIEFRGGILRTDAGWFDLRGARTRPAAPVGPPTAGGRRVREVLERLDPGINGILGTEGLPDRAHLAALLRSGEPAAVVDRLGGRGGGFTPAGDDVLAGLLLAGWSNGVGSWVGALEDLAAGARTGEPSASFLRWAARGHSIEAVHRFFDDLGQGRDPTPSVERIVTIGSSSGRALLTGLVLGMQHPGWWVPSPGTAARRRPAPSPSGAISVR